MKNELGGREGRVCGTEGGEEWDITAFWWGGLRKGGTGGSGLKCEGDVEMCCGMTV